MLWKILKEVQILLIMGLFKEANPNVKRSTLLSACNGNKKSAYGYKWKYVPMDIPTGEYHEID